jgi:hypothetical protein
VTHQALTERGRIAAHGRHVGLVSGALLLTVTILFAVVTTPSAFASTAPAAPAQLVSTGTAECPATNGCTGSSLATGMALAVTFNQAPSVTAPFSLTLTDGANKGTVSSSGATAAVNGSTATITLTAAPVMSVGTALSLSNLEILAATGVSSASGAWSLIASGQIDMADVTGSVSCVAIAATRFFGGTNCSIGFGAAGPTPPLIFDVIPVPTYDLMGPPEDAAPEVITNCQAGSSDTVYDAVTGAQLGADPCGTWLPGESTVGNTTSNTLDYIPTPMLASYEAVAATETLPGSLYVSATVLPPQVTGMTVSGSTATFTYNMPVTCQNPTSSHTASQFDYESPWWTTQAANLVWPTAISCPPSTGATTLTLTYNQTLPTAEKFKYEHYGPGYYIVGANGSASYNQVTPSQSMYRGPAALPPNPTITSFTPPTGPLPVTGGPLQVNFGIADATQCSLSASPSAGVGLSMPYITFTQDPAPSPNAPCPDSTGTATVTLPPNTTGSAQSYTITLTAASLPGTTPAAQSIVLVVPAGGAITQSAPTSAVTLAGTAYAGQLATNDPNPVTFTQTSGTPSITVSSTGAVSALSTLQAGTYTASGSDSDGTGAAGSWSFTLNVHTTTVASLVVTPATAMIAAGQSQTYIVEGFDSSGDDVGNVTASSSFVIGPNGSCDGAVCTATAADAAGGSHTVTVTDGSATKTVSLTVTAAAAKTVTATSGANQAAMTNAVFALPLTATVTDAFGNPVPNVVVTFSAPTTGASGAFSGVATATATTNTSGMAASPAFRANNTVGAYTVTASASGAATSAPFPESNQAQIDFQVQQANGTTTVTGQAADKVTVTSNSATASGQVTLTVLLQASSMSGLTATSSLAGASCQTAPPPAAYSGEVVCTAPSMSDATPWVVSLSLTATNKQVGAVAMVTAAGSIDPNTGNNAQDTSLAVVGGTTPPGTLADMQVTQASQTTAVTGQAKDKATVTSNATAGPVTLDLLFQTTALTSLKSQSSISGATCRTMAAPPAGYTAGLACTLSRLTKGTQWAVTATLNGAPAVSINDVAAVSAASTVDPNLGNNSQTTNMKYH